MNTIVRSIKSLKKNTGSEFTLFLAFALVCLVFTILSPHFFSMRNMLNIGIYSAIIGITAATTTLGLVVGCIDISVGGVMALSCMVVAQMLRAGASVPIAIIVAMLTGAACGAFNGIAVSKGKIVPMIATLATMSIFRGIAFLSNGGVSIVINNNNFKWIGRGYIGPIPFLIIIMIFVYFGVWYVSKYTAFGRKVYATGANSRASYLSGIRTSSVIFFVYLINGTIAGVSGILLAAQTGAGLPTAADGYEMTIISACILGGTSLYGGKGSVWGSFVGVILLTTISTGLTMLAVQTFWQQIIKGIILIVAVFIDVVRSGGYKKV